MSLSKLPDNIFIPIMIYEIGLSFAAIGAYMEILCEADLNKKIKLDQFFHYVFQRTKSIKKIKKCLEELQKAKLILINEELNEITLIDITERNNNFYAEKEKEIKKQILPSQFQLHGAYLEHAKKYGLKEAILLQYILIEIARRMYNGLNKFENKTWILLELPDLQKHFSYFRIDELKKIIQSLIEKEILVAKKESDLNMPKDMYCIQRADVVYPENPFFYSINDESLFFTNNDII